MPKKPHIQLSESEQEELQALLSKGNVNARIVRRAMALLQLHEGSSYTAVAKQLGVVIQTASTWASNYKEEGLACIREKPRSGRPKKISGIDQAKIVALACSKPPAGESVWTLRLLADYAVELIEADSISHMQVGRILKKTNSNPT